MSKFLTELLTLTEGHHPACGCGPCCCLSGWSEEDEKAQLEAEALFPENNGSNSYQTLRIAVPKKTEK
jgi:hypothetical protein